MASCGMASSSKFVVAPNVAYSTVTTPKATMVFFPSEKIHGSRLVVRAGDEATDSPLVEAPKATKPPLIGPARGSKVRVLRKESYWYKAVGSVVAVDQELRSRYPVVVRFNNVNYANVSTNNYALDELELLA